MKLETFCKYCEKELSFDNFTVKADIENRNELRHLYCKLLPAIDKKCTCGKLMKNNSSFLAIDLQRKYLRCKVTDVPSYLRIRSKTLDLAGVVVLPLYGDKIAHYKAYCYLGSVYRKYIECDGDSKKGSGKEISELSVLKELECRLALLIYVRK